VCDPVVKPEKSSEKITVCPEEFRVKLSRKMATDNLERSSDVFIVQIFKLLNLLALC